MAAKKAINSKIGSIKIYERSIVIPGATTIFIKRNDTIHKNFEQIVRTIKDCIEIAYKIGRKDKAKEIKEAIKEITESLNE